MWRVFGVWCFGRRLSAEVTVGRPCGGAQALPLAPGVGADKNTCGAMGLDPEGSTPSHESRPLVLGDTWRECGTRGVCLLILLRIVIYVHALVVSFACGPLERNRESFSA